MSFFRWYPPRPKSHSSWRRLVGNKNQRELEGWNIWDPQIPFEVPVEGPARTPTTPEDGNGVGLMRNPGVPQTDPAEQPSSPLLPTPSQQESLKGVGVPDVLNNCSSRVLALLNNDDEEDELERTSALRDAFCELDRAYHSHLSTQAGNAGHGRFGSVPQIPEVPGAEGGVRTEVKATSPDNPNPISTSNRLVPSPSSIPICITSWHLSRGTVSFPHEFKPNTALLIRTSRLDLHHYQRAQTQAGGSPGYTILDISSLSGDLVLHMSFRPSKGVLVFNTLRVSGPASAPHSRVSQWKRWDEEERIPLLPGYPFRTRKRKGKSKGKGARTHQGLDADVDAEEHTILIQNEDDAFRIYFDFCERWTFAKRLGTRMKSGRETNKGGSEGWKWMDGAAISYWPATFNADEEGERGLFAQVLDVVMYDFRL